MMCANTCRFDGRGGSCAAARAAILPWPGQPTTITLRDNRMLPARREQLCPIGALDRLFAGADGAGGHPLMQRSAGYSMTSGWASAT